MVIMLFEPALGRPVAFRILNRFELPLDFSIGATDAMGGADLKGPFSLRILTDRNNQPFESSPGELIGRSQKLLPLGTHGIVFLRGQRGNDQNLQVWVFPETATCLKDTPS